MSRRLLFVVNHAGFFLSHRLPLALAAVGRGWDVHVATPSSKHVASIEAAGLSWHPVRLTRSGTSPVGELRALRDIVALERSLRPDLVHNVTTKPVLWGTIGARIAGVPAVVNALAGLGHLSLAEDIFHRVVHWFVRIGFRVALRHRHMKVIFQNEVDRDVFTRAGILELDQTVMIRGSGVDTDIFQPGKSVAHDPPVVMLASRMLYTKGIAEFVEAARILRGKGVPGRFVLVGEPDPDNPASIDQRVLDTWSREENVEWWGRREDMPAVYAEADVVCLPSYREGTPKVLIEAAACGLPVVTTDVPGCRDVVVNEKTGLIVPVQDKGVHLAAAIERLLSDAGLRERMGLGGRERVLSTYALPRIIEQTLGLYEEMS